MGARILFRIALCFLLPGATATVYARQPVRQRGVLAEMESVRCGSTEKGGPTLAGALLTGTQKHKTQELLCQEYTIKSDRVTYKIRPTDEKHNRLLPVGEYVEFRLKKNAMVLRLPESDPKERDYIVVSMVATAEFATELENTRRPPKPHGPPPLSIDAVSAPVPAQPNSIVASDPPPAKSAEAPPAEPAVPLNPKQGMVLVQSNPSGADIYVDSAHVGRTPMDVNLKAGDHTLQLVLPGYQDWVTTFNVAAGTRETITASFARGN
jgi:PEGA domain